MSGKYKWVEEVEPGLFTCYTLDHYMDEIDKLPPSERAAARQELVREWLEEAQRSARIKVERLMFGEPA